MRMANQENTLNSIPEVLLLFAIGFIANKDSFDIHNSI